MKGEVTLKILERVKDAALGLTDLIDVLLSAGYGASLGKFEYEQSMRQRSRAQREAMRERRQDKREQEKKLRQRLHSMFYKLERDGLLKRTDENGKPLLNLTTKGERALELLKKESKNTLPTPAYEKRKGNNAVIVIFDIPESERRKRNWLRSALKNLGFRLVQKSVWVGTMRIPREFLEDLEKLRIISFVEIFEVSRTGSLEQIT